MRLKTHVGRLGKRLGAGDDDQRLQAAFDACHLVIPEHFDAPAKQVSGPHLQSEEFQSAIHRCCEIAIPTDRSTRQEIEQAAEKFDAISARSRDLP